MWVKVPASEKGKPLRQRVTLEREIPEGLWLPTENRFIDFVDINPPAQEEMELIEGEVPTLRIYNNSVAAYYNAPTARMAADVKKKFEHTALDDYI